MGREAHIWSERKGGLAVEPLRSPTSAFAQCIASCARSANASRCTTDLTPRILLEPELHDGVLGHRLGAAARAQTTWSGMSWPRWSLTRCRTMRGCMAGGSAASALGVCGMRTTHSGGAAYGASREHSYKTTSVVGTNRCTCKLKPRVGCLNLRLRRVVEPENFSAGNGGRLGHEQHRESRRASQESRN